MPRYAYKSYPYTKPPELTGGKVSDAPVVIVGAGPVGLAAAIDLAQHGIASVVLDDNDVVSVGSRAICWAKRTLEIFDRLGIGERVLEKGVGWQVGRQFVGEDALKLSVQLDAPALVCRRTAFLHDLIGAPVAPPGVVLPVGDLRRVPDGIGIRIAGQLPVGYSSLEIALAQVIGGQADQAHLLRFGPHADSLPLVGQGSQ